NYRSDLPLFFSRYRNYREQAEERVFRYGPTALPGLCAMRSLRAVPEPLPYLPALGSRGRFAARTIAADGAHRSRATHAGRRFCDAYRPVPGLPRVRDGVPFRRRVRKIGRVGARANRTEL